MDPKEDESYNKICTGKVKPWKPAPWTVQVRQWTWVCIQYFQMLPKTLLFVLRFSNSDKTDNPRLGFKNGHKDEQCSQIAADVYVVTILSLV